MWGMTQLRVTKMIFVSQETYMESRMQEDYTAGGNPDHIGSLCFVGTLGMCH